MFFVLSLTLDAEVFTYFERIYFFSYLYWVMFIIFLISMYLIYYTSKKSVSFIKISDRLTNQLSNLIKNYVINNNHKNNKLFNKYWFEFQLKNKILLTRYYLIDSLCICFFLLFFIILIYIYSNFEFGDLIEYKILTFTFSWNFLYWIPSYFFFWKLIRPINKNESFFFSLFCIVFIKNKFFFKPLYYMIDRRLDNYHLSEEFLELNKSYEHLYYYCLEADEFYESETFRKLYNLPISMKKNKYYYLSGLKNSNFAYIINKYIYLKMKYFNNIYFLNKKRNKYLFYFIYKKKRFKALQRYRRVYKIFYELKQDKTKNYILVRKYNKNKKNWLKNNNFDV